MDGQNKKISFLIYVEWREQLEMLSDEECGKLIKALLAYVCDGTKPELSGAVNMAFAFIRAQIDRDLEKWEDKCQKRSDAGRKGGIARASKAKQTSSKSKQSQATLSNAKQSQANQADKEKEKEKEEDKENESIITPHSPPRGDMFEKFWSAYPRKTAKRNALRAFEKLNVTEALLTEMLAALDWQRQTEGWTKDGGQFIPHASTWLNGRRWEDERPVQVQKSSNPFLDMLKEMEHEDDQD